MNNYTAYEVECDFQKALWRGDVKLTGREYSRPGYKFAGIGEPFSHEVELGNADLIQEYEYKGIKSAAFWADADIISNHLTYKGEEKELTYMGIFQLVEIYGQCALNDPEKYAKLYFSGRKQFLSELEDE